MTPKCQCPLCQADLDYYDSEGRLLSRAMGMVEQGIYDGILYWQCPFCGGRWHRFEPGTYQYSRAEEYVSA